MTLAEEIQHLIAEFRKGCSVAPNSPYGCPQCTEALISAINSKSSRARAYEISQEVVKREAEKMAARIKAQRPVLHSTPSDEDIKRIIERINNRTAAMGCDDFVFSYSNDWT